MASNTGEGECTARFGGREIFCHHLDPAPQSVDTTPPRGDNGPQLAAGFINHVPRPVITHVPAAPGAVPPLQIPRFLFGSFRS